MTSIKVGNKIFSRLVDLYNGMVTPSTVNKLSDEQTKSIATTNFKVAFIRSIINAMSNGKLDFTH
jgi:hypothetical protein